MFVGMGATWNSCGCLEEPAPQWKRRWAWPWLKYTHTHLHVCRWKSVGCATLRQLEALELGGSENSVKPRGFSCAEAPEKLQDFCSIAA